MAVAERGQRVNRSTLADVFGVALPTVDGWVRAGCPVLQRGSRGVEWAFNTAAISQWLRDRAVSDATGEKVHDKDALDLRKLAAHGLIEDAQAGSGDARERWWRPAAAGISTRDEDFRDAPERAAVHSAVGRMHARQQHEMALACTCGLVNYGVDPLNGHVGDSARALDAA